MNGAKLTKVKEVPKVTKLPWGKDVVIGGLTDEQDKVTQAFTGGMIGIRFVEKPLTDDEISLDSSSCKPRQAGTAIASSPGNSFFPPSGFLGQCTVILTARD